MMPPCASCSCSSPRATSPALAHISTPRCKKYAELDALTREARDLSLRCELLSARAPKGDVPDKPVVRPARSRAELQTALDALARCRREAQSTFDYTSGRCRCRAIGDAAELEAALTQKRDELAQKQAEYDAIALAMESLQSANTALQNRFSPALSRRAGELFLPPDGRQIRKRPA